MFSGTSPGSRIPIDAAFARAHRSMRGAVALHPLVAAAAISIIVLAAVGVGVLTGLLPSPLAKSAPTQELTEASAPAGGRDFGKASAHAPAPAKQAAAERAAPTRAASRPAPVYREPARPVAATCGNCGTVESVRAVQVQGQGTGLGAVGGGVVERSGAAGAWFCCSSRSRICTSSSCSVGSGVSSSTTPALAAARSLKRFIG